MSISNLEQFPVVAEQFRPPPLRAVGLVEEASDFKIDLLANPPDEALLIGADFNKLLAAEIIPWRRFGQRLVYVTGKQEIDAPQLPDGIRYVNFVAADPDLIRQYIDKRLTS
ncbi:MAG: hypothetical protein JKY41_10920 [Rhodobacteraceae bacterium]|nr:hypothetical protein [Paracoccaceae bacterium]